MKKNIIIGSRGSILALAQTNLVKDKLEKYYPNLSFEIKEIVTCGDKDLKSNWENSDVSLKSFFTKEIEQELLDGDIDIAVHSMKDMPAISPKGLICGAIPDREDARDVLVSKNGFLVTLPQGAKIGTSSLRRAMNLKAIRPDFEIKHLRGNIHTRLKKLETEDYNAIILAAAGLKRTGMADKITEYLSGEAFPPAPAQGVLYIQCRENDEEIKEILKSIHNENVAKIVEIEREFSKIFDGGCHTPMGCYSQINGDKIKFTAVYSDEGKQIRAVIEDDLAKGKEIAYMAAEEIKKKIIRCDWANKSELEKKYHDEEWGIPVHNDKKLFKMLILEGKQAGLSWTTVLSKMETLYEAFDDFDPNIIIKYDDKKVEELLKNEGVIRNKLKIDAVINNAKQYFKLCEEFGSLDKYLWAYVDNKPIKNSWTKIEEVPARTELSDKISKDLKKRGFKFVGSTIIYAFMQAIGMVNDHLVTCSFYNKAEEKK